MYYLQSRYYDPDLCRFISADDFAYINTDTPMSVNAYVYCINNPLKYKDPKGTKASNESPTYLVEAVLDIILSLMIFDEISINMIDIFGYDLTDNFFGFLSNIFLLIPPLPKLFLDLIKSIPDDI